MSMPFSCLSSPTKTKSAASSARLADHLAIAARGEEAFEDEAVGHGGERTLGPHIEAPGKRCRGIVQTAAVGSVERGHPLAFPLQPPRGKPGIGPAFGAMAVQDIDGKTRGKLLDLAVAPPIAEGEPTRHGT